MLPNPNKAVQALRLQSGAIAILFDNQKGAKTRTHRKLSPMTIALSYDNGTTWPYAKVRRYPHRSLKLPPVSKRQ